MRNVFLWVAAIGMAGLVSHRAFAADAGVGQSGILCQIGERPDTVADNLTRFFRQAAVEVGGVRFVRPFQVSAPSVAAWGERAYVCVTVTKR